MTNGKENVKIFNYLVSTFILLSCMAYKQGEDFGVTQGHVFLVGIPILIIASLFLKPKRMIVNRWFAACLGFVTLTYFLLKGPPQKAAFQPLVYAVMGGSLFYILSNTLENIKPILDGICWAVGFQGVIVLLQLLGIDPICMNDNKTGMNTALVGLYGYKYVYSAWMAIATPVLLFNKKIAFGILSFLMCISSMCLAPIGLMFAALILGVGIYKPKLLILSLIAAILAGVGAWVFVLNSPTNQALLWKFQLRFILESKLLPILFQKPLFGWGLGSFKYIGSQVWNSSTGSYGTMVDAWNTWLETAIEVGLPILIPMAGLVWNTFKRFAKVLKTPQMVGVGCSLIIIPFGMLFHSYFIHSSLCVLMISLLASFEILYNGV